jgi:hypothetical protein
MHRRGGRNDLKETQEQVVALLRGGELRQLTRRAYQELTGVSRSQAAYDLAELVEKGILRQDGAGRATSYGLVHEESRGHRRWTEERIRAELAAFCAGREAWPSAGDFKAAERGHLYVAASRYGGIAYWAAELGFPERPRARTSTTSLRRRLAFAAAAAAVAAALIAGALALRHGGVARTPAAVPRGATPATPLEWRTTPSFARQRPHGRTPSSTKSKPNRPRKASRPSLPKAASTPALAAQRTPAASHSANAPAARPAARGPAPLAAPNSSSAPAPLAAP